MEIHVYTSHIFSCFISSLWLNVHVQAAQFFLGKVTALGVLCCFALFVCLTLLASFFLPSHLSLKKYVYVLNDLYIYSIVSKRQKGLGTEQEAYMYNHVHVYKLAYEVQPVELPQ